MSTTTNEKETTGIENFPRDISELLDLKSYQEMTDEEIETVINYKIEREVSSQRVQALLAAQQQTIDDVIAIWAQQAASDGQALSYVINNTIPDPQFTQPTRINLQSTIVYQDTIPGIVTAAGVTPTELQDNVGV